MDDALFDFAEQMAGLLGLTGTLLGVIGVLFCRKRAWLWHGVAAGFAGLLAAAGLLALTVGLPLPVWVAAFGLAGAIAACQLLQLGAVGRLLSQFLGLLQWKCVPSGTLLATCPLVALWCALHLKPTELGLPGVSSLDATKVVEVTDLRAVTDAGRRVPLFTMLADEAEAGHTLDDAHVVKERLARLIRTAPPDATHNCHGWVFAAAKRWIKGREVDMILTDNGYQAVIAPRPGDVVVYRSSGDGAVLHTGLVRVAEPGLILIESKWGALGRYVHQPDDQCYGNRFTYYRSERRDNTLLGLNSGSTLPTLPRRLGRSG